jgi:ATP adenylyltransferase/5',5'''-P-1,P-4-tetraphosphate phosphorylase II
MNDRFITADQMAPYLQGETLAEHARALLLQQNDAWGQARDGYQALESVKTKTFLFDGYVVKVQYNPGRLVSTTARTDLQSVSERPCFLCERHLPSGQKALAFGDAYMILVNPFPIFNEHFTIVHREHRPQRIAGSFADLVDLTAELGSRYALLYNGPRSGASAPDHLHFQAGDRAFIPIDFDYAAIKERFGRPLHASARLKVVAVDGYLRRFIGIESEEKVVVVEAFYRIYERFLASGGYTEEPMMNILLFLDPNGMRVILVPRRTHRPSHFYREGDRRILISPGAVDLGGTCTIPTREDFERVTREDIAEIFEEVCLPGSEFGELTGSFAEGLRGM